jgi:hypothetical protein
VSLLTELDAFFTDHRRCGDLDGGVDGPIVWMACEGASEHVRPDVLRCSSALVARLRVGVCPDEALRLAYTTGASYG